MAPVRRLVLLVVALVAGAWLALPARADTVYVVSFTTGGLYSFDTADPADTFTTRVTAGSMTKPAAITVGPDGNLYIGADGDGATVAPSIHRYAPATGLTTVHTFSGFDVFPGSLAFKGSDLLVGRNPFFGNTGPIVRVTGATSGATAVSDYTTGGDLASSPGLALAADGTLYVSDQTYDFGTGVASGPVKRFGPTGAYDGVLIADGTNGLVGPTGLALRGDTLYTVSIGTGSVLQTSLGPPAVTGPFAATGVPFGVGAIALLSDGGLVGGNPAGNGVIYRFAPDGSSLSSFSSGLGQIGGLVAVPEPSWAACGLAGLAAAAWLRARRVTGRR